MSNTLTSKVSGRMSSRSWAIAIGAAAVVLAAILLIVYLDRYRARVSGENAPTPVLVAKQLIPAGTPGTLVASQHHVRADDASAQGGRGRSDRRSAVPERTRRGDGHLPGPAVHGDRLRRRSEHDRQVADRRAPSARSRSRSTTSTEAWRRSRRATPSTSTSPSAAGTGSRREALPSEREGARGSDARRAEHWCSASTRRTRPTSRTQPTTRSSGSSSGRSSAPSRLLATPRTAATVLR